MVASEESGAPRHANPEDQAMHHNFALYAGPLCFAIYRNRLEEFLAHADECQRLADGNPSIKHGYEGVATSGEHSRKRATATLSVRARSRVVRWANQFYWPGPRG